MAGTKNIMVRKASHERLNTQLCFSFKLYKILIYFIFIIFSIPNIHSQIPVTEWPLFRGTADLSGLSKNALPSSPSLLWSISTGVRTKSSPVISDGTVFFGNEDGQLVAVTSEGKIKWKYTDSSYFEAPPLVFGNKLIAGTNQGILRAVDKVSGKLIWSYATENQISGSANVWSSGSRSGIVVGSYDYYLHCVDPRTGRMLWKVETENYVNGSPAIASGKVIFGGCDGMLRIIDPLTGAQKNNIEIGVYIASSPALAGEFAYLGDYDGTLYCVNTVTGKIIWIVKGSGEGGSILAIPAVGNGCVIIGSEDKYLYCYNSADGQLRWKYRTNARITGSAVICGDRVIFNGMDGFITILSIKDGKKLWSFNTGSPVSSSPAVISGRFYILTDDGRLLAFGDKPLK